MIKKDKNRVTEIASKLQGANLLSVIGATLSKKGITQEAFDNIMRESEHGLMNPFGCNVSNGIQNIERGYGKSLTIDEVQNLLTELSHIIAITKVLNKEEKSTDRIVVENGDMFEGSRNQFRDCYFDNANNEQIVDWCEINGWTLEINGEKVL